MPQARTTTSGDRDDLGVDYAFLRKVVGVIGLALPVAVELFAGLLDGHWQVQRSISSYYYTAGRNWLVGTLCALAVFLLSYHHRANGTYRLDNVLTTLAAGAALGVAFFPVADAPDATAAERAVGAVHLTAAGLLFAVLGTLALFVFTRDGGGPTPRKRVRNAVYRVCGALIFAGIAGVVLAEVVRAPAGWHAVFWLETLMVWSFAVSWLVKGGFLGVLVDPVPAAGPVRVA